MIELTKNQRLEAYRYARTEIIDGDFSEEGICFHLISVIDKYSNYPFDHPLGYDRDDMLTILPEFGKCKPTFLTPGDPWWPFEDVQSRIDLLNHIISEMEKELELA